MRNFLLLIIISIWSCSDGARQGWPEKNLIEYGVPMTIKAPEGVQVNKRALGFQQDIVIKDDSNYNVQIFVSDAIVATETAALQAQRELVEESPFFHQVIKNDENGFIFENKVDSTHSSFGFRYIKLMGGKEYIFQEGLMGNFSQEAVESMYNGVVQN